MLAERWTDVMDMMDDLSDRGFKDSPDNWLLIDMVGRLWEMAQSYEVGEVYGKRASEFLLGARAAAVEAAKLGQPPSMPTPDWNVIKKFHNDDFMDLVCARWKSNIVATTGADPIIQEWARPEDISFFGPLGYKPDGEKRNIHRFDTIMFLVERKGDRQFSTLKDRGRKLIKNQPFTNLWQDYDFTLRDQESTPFF